MKFDMSIFPKSVKKIQVSSKPDMTIGYFELKRQYISDVLFNSSYNEKCFRYKLQRISEHTFYVQ